MDGAEKAMIDFAELRCWAQEEGFGETGICSIRSFDAQREQVSQQPILKERKQLRFTPQDDDPRIRSLAVLLWPYAQAAMPPPGQLFVDSYYEASNAAYHAAARLEKRLADAGVFVRANSPYPAKAAAMRSGLGLIGKNGLLIHPRYGSRVVIILMATDIECPQEDAAPQTRCLECGRCALACPSGAITENGMCRPEKCLRNFMMEGVTVPPELRAAMDNRLLGCDMCQRVCPMQPHGEQAQAVPWTLDDFVSDDPSAFSDAVKRLGQQIGRNAARPQRVRAQAALLCGNAGTKAHLSVLDAWSASEFEAVREHARWATEQIRKKKALP